MASKLKKSTIPNTDDGFLKWSVTFKNITSAAPATYNMTAAQCTDYTNHHNLFAAALQLASDPLTRSKPNITAKNDARDALKTLARSYGKMIESLLTVTDAQKLALGLNVPAQRTPIPVPSQQPSVDIVSVVGRTVKVRVHGTDTARRGKPAGVAGAQVYSFVGEVFPEDPMAWTFEGSTTRAVFDINLPLTVPAGTLVWIKACWFNPRNQCGEPCQPVSTYLQVGNTSQAA